MKPTLKQILKERSLQFDGIRTNSLSEAIRCNSYQWWLKEKLPGVIAEIKFTTGSGRRLKSSESWPPEVIARRYVTEGAIAVSVVTMEKFFNGRMSYMKAVKDANLGVPILCKDFITEPRQVLEAKHWGADAILLIAKLLEPWELANLYRFAIFNGLEPLIEVHTEREMETAMKISPTVIGINNRDLDNIDKEPDLNVTKNLCKKYGKDIKSQGALLVAMSGIRDLADQREMRSAGVHATLIGESAMERPGLGVHIMT